MENQGTKIDTVKSRKHATYMRGIAGKFRVTFIKQDGAVRKMNARMKGDVPSKGGKSTLDPTKYTTVWDVDNGGYRAVNNDTIIELEEIA